jgi:hypothetical protein
MWAFKKKYISNPNQVFPKLPHVTVEGEALLKLGEILRACMKKKGS